MLIAGLRVCMIVLPAEELVLQPMLVMLTTGANDWLMLTRKLPLYASVKLTQVNGPGRTQKVDTFPAGVNAPRK